MASTNNMKFITALDLGQGDKVRTARLPDEIRNKLKGIVESGTLKLKTKPHIVCYGNLCQSPRAMAFYSDDSYGYFFSQSVAKSEALTPELTELLEFVNNEMSTDYNGILINAYEDGDSIAAHADNEKALMLDDVGVVAINFGATRHMYFTTTDPADPCQLGKKCRIELVGGHLMQMKGGTFQQRFKHAIRAEKGAGRRISLTFRKHDIEKEKPAIARVPAMEARIAKLISEKEAAAGGSTEPAAKRAKTE